MAERFRDLVRPALVDVGARSTPSGGSQAAAELSQSLAQFSRTAGTIGATLFAQSEAQRGAQEGAAGDPQFRRGLNSLTVWGRAYNDSALRSYAIQSEADMAETAARLEVDANGDPGAFREGMAKVLNGILAEAPVEAHGAITEMYAGRTAEGLGRIQAELSTEILAEDRELVFEQVENLIERSVELRARDTPESIVLADEEELRLSLLLDGAAADGTLSRTEAVTARREARTRIISESVLVGFREEMASPDGDSIGFIEDYREIVRNSQDITPAEEEELEARLFEELRETNALRAARQSQADAAAEARLEAGDRAATVAMLRGELTRRDLSEAVENGDLSPSVSRTLNNELQQQATSPPKSNQRELAHVRLNLLNYEEEDILTNSELTWDDRADLIERRRTEAQGWRGTQRARESFDRVDRALGILPGTPVQLLDEIQLRARDNALTLLYDNIDALPPEEREAALFVETERVIQTVIRENAALQLERLERRLADKLNRDVSAMSDRDQRNHEADIQNLRNRITETRAQAQGGTSQ